MYTFPYIYNGYRSRDFARRRTRRAVNYEGYLALPIDEQVSNLLGRPGSLAESFSTLPTDRYIYTQRISVPFVRWA